LRTAEKKGRAEPDEEFYIDMVDWQRKKKRDL